MKALLYTNEFPPYTYGGAGVHVGYLSRELAKLVGVDVRAFGDQDSVDGSTRVKGYDFKLDEATAPKHLLSVLGAIGRGLNFNLDNIDADVVHCHTWYVHMAGILTKMAYGIPLVVTVHSLEPLRPWKREQLEGGYDFSLWVEKTALEMADAVVAVSAGTRRDVLEHFAVDPDKIEIIYNGIDPEEFRKVDPKATLQRFGIPENEPYILFIGRITRQKGIIHLVDAIKHLDKGFNVVLCAGAPDTPAIAKEMASAVSEVQKEREGVYWVEDMVDKKALIQLYSGADVFCCPSIYEPFGIINLEAMACETPVVASAVGGIPEVVVHDETGYLVPVAQEPESPFSPLHPEAFAKDLAFQVNRLMANPERRAEFAAAGRKRAIENFSWTSIAEQTSKLYESLLEK
jgi:glycogen synthase|tara:strand:+ start:8802 stop:10007 length:1206 start_codon:yes stop_codon:yes gene_type:complete